MAKIDPEPYIYRASKDCLCPTCRKTYDRHPLAEEPEYRSKIDGEPYLHRLCNGDLVKL